MGWGSNGCDFDVLVGKTIVRGIRIMAIMRKLSSQLTVRFTRLIIRRIAAKCLTLGFRTMHPVWKAKRLSLRMNCERNQCCSWYFTFTLASRNVSLNPLEKNQRFYSLNL